MSKRYAVLYSDGSLSVSGDGKDLIEAKKYLSWEKSDEDSKFVEVEIKITKVHNENNVLQVVTEHSAECPICGTEVFIEIPLPKPPTAEDLK